MKMKQRSLSGWRLPLVALPLLMVVFGLMLTTTPAWAAQVTNITFPISETVFNPCNGEVVTLSGEEHMTESVTLDGSGGFHMDIHGNLNVTGSGNQGNKYVGNQDSNFQMNGRVGVEFTVTGTFSEISLGSAPNFVLHDLVHITVNPDGTVTSSIFIISPECQG